VTSGLEDPAQKVGFIDDHWLHLPGGRGAAVVTEEAVYLALSLRNAGNGLAVLDRWDLLPEHSLNGRATSGPPKTCRASDAWRAISPSPPAEWDSGKVLSATPTTLCSRP